MKLRAKRDTELTWEDIEHDNIHQVSKGDTIELNLNDFEVVDGGGLAHVDDNWAELVTYWEKKDKQEPIEKLVGQFYVASDTSVTDMTPMVDKINQLVDAINKLNK